MSLGWDAIERALAAGERDAARAALLAVDWRHVGDPQALGRAAGHALGTRDAALALVVAQRFVEVAPRFAGAHHALGLSHLLARDLAAAEAALLQALALAPGTPMVLLHLGGVRLERHDRDGAFAAYDQCVRIDPEWRDARIGRGIARLRAFRADAALDDFRWWTAREPANPDAWRGYAEALELDGRYDELIVARERELALAPDDLARRREAGFAYARIGITTRARALLEAPVADDPSDLRARWAHWQMMPLMYRDDAELAAWRAQWEAGLAAFEALDVATLAHAQLVDALLVHSSFFMHYQGGDLTALQRRYGALVSRYAQAAFPGTYARAAPRAAGKLRVGFASAYFRRHTVRGLFQRWLAELDRGRHTVVAIHLGGVSDDVTEALPEIADEVMRGHATNDAWVAALAEAELDVLVWLDIGMDSLTQLLAALRFAPVTAVAWGHPITSGYGSVDAFLSSAAMEPPGGAAHYTEQLVRLPNLSISYPYPQRRGKPRTPYDGSRPIRLLCVQSVFKLTPANHVLLARVMARLPDAELHMTPHPSPHVRAELEALLRERFAEHGAAFDGRVKLHPALKHEVFFQLMEHCDVYLDTLGWSGGHTTLEALSTDLPIVTSPGEFMRARHTYAMLHLMQLDAELVAADVDDYVAKVAALAESPQRHAEAVAAIAARKHVLYSDAEAVRGLERWIARATGRAA